MEFVDVYDYLGQEDFMGGGTPRRQMRRILNSRQGKDLIPPN